MSARAAASRAKSKIIAIYNNTLNSFSAMFSHEIRTTGHRNGGPIH